jgi:hypothetical protein
MSDCPYDLALKQYELARESLRQLRHTLRRKLTADQQQLFSDLRNQMRLAFWQARLEQKLTPATVAATPFCRELRLGPNQSKHADELFTGMLAAERSLSEHPYGAAPWNLLIWGRAYQPDGLPRNQFEIGYVMRLYQLLQELAALNQLKLKDYVHDSPSAARHSATAESIGG